MEPAAALAAAEAAFAAHSVREDMRAAFLAHFASDGVFVRSGWALANAHLASQAAPPIVLDWRPVYTEVARSGELGLSTGPWKITSKTKPDDPPSFGQFVSVWRRAPGGPWQVAVDLGIGHPQSALWKAKLDTKPLRAPGEAAPEALTAAEKRFAATALAAGLRAAYAQNAAEDFRFYRNGSAPVIGKAAALAAPGTAEMPVTWTIERSETAKSADFGYARGSYAADGAAKPLGYFLRVWRVERGAWRIVLDVTNPARP
jgi:ketosteroid isomerase-like protein